MQDLILIGGGGHCKSCIDVIEQENKFNIIGILDVAEKVGQKVYDYEILGTDFDIQKFVDRNCSFLITVGHINSADLRIKLLATLKRYNAKLATIISPRAYVSEYAKIGAGTIIMHDVLVNAGSIIGENCIINTKVLLEHDTVVENNCHIAVGAVIAGESRICQGTFVGANATIIQSVTVSENSFIKAGSLVK